MLKPYILVKLKDVQDSSSYPLPKFDYHTLCDNQEELEKDTTNYFFSLNERRLLNIEKNKINNKYTTKEWDKAKKLTNPYELIHIPNRKIKSESISRYDPLSRSFFKLWEIINYFYLIRDRNQINTSHLAEGPGGFLEAVLYFRQRIMKVYPLLDRYTGITLNPYSKEIPGWTKANNLIRQYRKNIEIDYGIDQSGDLYQVHNINSFSKKCQKYGGSVLVSADGGFDFSVDFNQQEQLSHRLILAQLLTAIKSQKKSGTLICKFFDTYTYLSSQILYFISCLYQETYFIKPLTSRPANSEKYLVAIGYKGFNNHQTKDYYLNEIGDLLNDWNNINQNGFIVSSLFENPPQSFMNKIKEYNYLSYQQQKKYIQQTLDIIQDKPNWTQMETILDHQVSKAVEWCHNYHLSVNLESYFYQKYQYHQNIKNGIKVDPRHVSHLKDLDKYFENFIGYHVDL